MNVHIEPREKYLYIKVDGIINLADSKKYFKQAFDTCGELDLQNVLIDLRSATGRITIMERYKYARYLVMLQRSFIRTHGMLIRPAFVGFEPLVDRDRFGMMVGRYRGGIGLVTDDIDEAMEWLENGQADKADVDKT